MLLRPPVLDDGRDLGVEQRNLQANVNTLKAQLDAFTFDPKTGAQVYTVQGAARETLQARMQQATTAAAYFGERAAAISAQRAAGQSTNVASQNERLAQAAFTNGNPARAAALAEALLRAEADEAARVIIETRRVNRG